MVVSRPFGYEPLGTPGDNLECCHPRCTAKPQERYPFPIPLCRRHIIRVLARSLELTRQSRREHVVSNNAPLPAPIDDAIAEVDHAPVVYYVRFADRVKIGTSTNLRSRLSALPHDEVLAVEPGGVDVERRRHAQFCADRIIGEWFDMSDALKAHIDGIRSQDVPP